MSAFDLFRNLYSLDTLDTRFTTSSTTPLRDVLSPTGKEPSDNAIKSLRGSEDRKGPPDVPLSRWNTTEFYIYYLVFIICVPQMFKAVIDVSQPSNPNFEKYASLLSEGWIPGRNVDNSDAQYASFRDNIPYMAVVVVLHPLLRRLYTKVASAGRQQPAQVQNAGVVNRNVHLLQSLSSSDSHSEQRLAFDFYFALLFIVTLHGVSAFKIIAILYTNYCIATRLPKGWITVATWMFNIAILFANELSDGYTFRGLAENLLSFSSQAVPIGDYIDGFGGIIPRWQILYKVTILRQISFNLDYLWSLDQRTSSPIEKKQVDPSSLSERDRISIPAAPAAFTFRNYVSYALYSPLFIAGPIITFNDYISQTRYPSPSLNLRRTLLYGVRFLLTLISMELILHYIYAVAISKSNPDWNVYTPFQLSMLGYFNLHIIWLKLLLPWRFFRLWALIDGIDPPENTIRCMSDNYSTLAFWRGWHRSFNRWTVRYLYVPLGGGAAKGGISRVRATLNMLAVFSFIALWHDIQLRLLMWGWMATLFVLPEMLATVAFPKSRWEQWPNAYRVLCGVGAVGNILMLMAANLVGFAVGLDGLKGLVGGILGSLDGLLFFLLACSALFVGVQVMFEIRAEEARKGIKLKC